MSVFCFLNIIFEKYEVMVFPFKVARYMFMKSLLIRTVLFLHISTILLWTQWPVDQSPMLCGTMAAIKCPAPVAYHSSTTRVSTVWMSSIWLPGMLVSGDVRPSMPTVRPGPTATSKFSVSFVQQKQYGCVPAFVWRSKK